MILSGDLCLRTKWGFAKYMLPPFPLMVVMHVVIELAREGVLGEILCVDDLFLMSDTIDGHRNRFRKWKDTFWSKG